jgi:hypothetical protein
VPDVKEFIEEAVETFDVQIYSSRSRQDGGILCMKGYLCYRVGLPMHFVEDYIQFPTEKPAAFLTIDDRAITFEGDWRKFKPVRKLLDWKPLNKKGV